MAWVEYYIKEYTKERDQLLKKRWLTRKSWFARSKESTKYQEIERLLRDESSFNEGWLKRLEHAVVKHRLKDKDLVLAKLLIDTHTSKHKERDFFIIIIGVLFTASIKMLGNEVLFSSAIVTTALILGYERLFGSTTKNSLEEFKSILDMVLKSKEGKY
ncbi:hypothetical protein OPW32_19635 [Vibrio europaeus]|uniref:hypothetical protein n=1 Tax=Vibrio europaeus TaxID=300876 RepID=UPI002341AFF1|nr:hypothetical protein [Vibrio europaeus]MDC5851401.1 hypothetical protein [Vibrio europaeus]